MTVAPKPEGHANRKRGGTKTTMVERICTHSELSESKRKDRNQSVRGFEEDRLANVPSTAAMTTLSIAVSVAVVMLFESIRRQWDD